MRGKRATWGGRQEARSTLFMAALVVTHFSSVIRAVYQRLIAAGEPKELTLTAAVRTLVVFLKAILRTGTPGRPWRARHEPAARQSLVPSAPAGLMLALVQRETHPKSDRLGCDRSSSCWVRPIA